MTAEYNDHKFNIEYRETERGFSIAEFTDLYGQKCSLQDSSLATTAAIWLGVDINLNGQEVCQRMHLSQNMVRKLLPLLGKFAETGNI